ncbi:MAG TPA: hypothetical protein DEQ74_03060, partial [Wolbachia sp.]|nr:hypothetical protein [Wolbachia sp.]
MKKYTFKVDVNNASSYDRLIKIPTAYYRLASNGEGKGDTLHSHNNHSIPIGNRNNLTLIWDAFSNKMVLCYNNEALKIDGNDFTIGQEDFIDSTHTQEIVTQFKSEFGTKKLASIYHIPNYRDYGIKIPVNDDVSVVLNFINFYNENDPVLQSITNKTNGLYFTIEDSSQNYSRSAYISYQDGRIFRAYEDSPYRFSLYPYYYRLHDLEIKEELEKKIQSLEEKLDKVQKMPGLKGDKGELGLPGNKGQDGPKGASGERGEKGNIGDSSKDIKKSDMESPHMH